MNKLEPIKKLNAREPKVANGGMPSRDSGTYNKDCHGAIPAKMDVNATVAKVLKGR